MASEAQIEANRANAARSTGPKSPEGKENSRKNALRHGFEARTVAALGEDDGTFERYLADLAAALLPQDTYEFVLVRRMARLSWRLERLSRLEAALLDSVANRNAGLDAIGVAPFYEKPTDDLWTADLVPIGRYEAQLDNAFKRNMLLLERHRADRRAVKQAAIVPLPDPLPDAEGHQIWKFRNEANSPAETPAPMSDDAGVKETLSGAAG